MYRDLSFSLAAHVALIGALLALSATRQTARIPEVVRPVRLVTYLEPPAAAPVRAPRPAAPALPLGPPERAPAPAAARPAPPPARTVAPVAVPRIVIPTAQPAPAARQRPAQRPATAAADETLRDRLAQRLAAPAATPAATASAAPRIASLPRPEEPATPPRPVAAASPATTAAVPPTGDVQPVGYFPHSWYLMVLKDRIFARWSPPSEFYVGAARVAALVSFRVDRAGRVSRAAVKESSGHARFDRSALTAVQGLERLPALPEQYAEETLDVVIRFQNE